MSLEGASNALEGPLGRVHTGPGLLEEAEGVLGSDRYQPDIYSNKCMIFRKDCVHWINLLELSNMVIPTASQLNNGTRAYIISKYLS